jgi:hypothetical protein
VRGARRAALVAAVVVGAMSCSTGAPDDRVEQPSGARVADGTKDGVSEAEARSIATQHARAAGHDLAIYRLIEARLEPAAAGRGARWVVRFEHAPPTPPGGHFLVWVDAATRAAELAPGE